jgi:hypothetical protein
MSEQAKRSSSKKTDSSQLPFNWSQEQTEAALHVQKAVLECCEEANHALLARIQSEVSLWSDLFNHLSQTKTIPEAVDIYTKGVTQRLKMAVDDGRMMGDASQHMAQKLMQAVGDAWPTAHR